MERGYCDGPICCFCTRLHRCKDGLSVIPMACSAYPKGIPIAILYSQDDHRKPDEGDGRFRFESRDAHGVAYVERILPG